MNYEQFKKFIINDLKIKKEMISMAPPSMYAATSKDSIVDYTNNAYDSLKYIIFLFKNMTSTSLTAFRPKVDELSNEWMNQFIECKTDINKLTAFYKNTVTDMSENIVKSVKKECQGYNWSYFPVKALRECKTINELLHIMHSTVINNDHILSSLNVVSKKELLNHQPVTLYGEPTELSQKLYEDVPDELNIGITDIVSFGNVNKVVMMVRDIGHALSIELDYSGDDVLVSYFIPKLCNKDMINALPGVVKVSPDAETFSGTTGRFVTKKDNLSEKLYYFISQVPTDRDLPEYSNSNIK